MTMTTTDRCTCERGWRPVSDAYARQEAEIPQAADLDSYRLSPPGSDMRARWAAYRAHKNSVYPCPTCRPEAMRRWQNGCYRSGHVPCITCR